MAYGYETFVKNMIDIPIEETEPICPFNGKIPIECNEAYSEACFGCPEAIKAYRCALEAARA